MPRIKGKPFKGTEIRQNRIIRLTDSGWAALKEVADLTGVSRGDIIEFWMAMLNNNEEQMQKIAESENLTIETLMQRLIELSPDNLRQLRANSPMAREEKPLIDLSKNSDLSDPGNQ